jgi:hypothetical protein
MPRTAGPGKAKTLVKLALIAGRAEDVQALSLIIVNELGCRPFLLTPA